MNALRFTTSWDDGHPLDLRVAELLASYGFRGTFYVPRRNVEGRPVLGTAELRTLAKDFEIGCHTIDHVRLRSLSIDEARRQIGDGKLRLEDELGRAVDGFCYPGGFHTPAIRELVKTAGFRYARTIDNLCIEAPRDAYRLPTTLQLYPHGRVTYLKNFARGRSWPTRAATFGLALVGNTLEQVLMRILDRAEQRGGVFHLWGHSWELEAHQLWKVLERFLAAAQSRVDPEHRIDNAGLLKASI